MTPSNPLRPYIWGLAAVLLALPAVFMQFTDEVDWTTGDFVAMGLLLGGGCVAYEVVARLGADWRFRLGGGLAVLGTVLMVWVNLAVGIIGNEADPVNRLFFALPVIGLVAAAAGRFRAAGLANAMIAMVAGQLVMAVVAFIEQGLATAFLTAAFSLFWIAAWRLFARAEA